MFILSIWKEQFQNETETGKRDRYKRKVHPLAHSPDTCRGSLGRAGPAAPWISHMHWKDPKWSCPTAFPEVSCNSSRARTGACVLVAVGGFEGSSLNCVTVLTSVKSYFINKYCWKYVIIFRKYWEFILHHFSQGGDNRNFIGI